MIIQMIRQRGLAVTDIAKELDVATSQIYYWNKHGISKNNKHFEKLQKILPEIKPKEPTLRIDEQEDRRYNSGRKTSKLHLTTLQNNLKPKPQSPVTSTLFPKITIKKKND